MIEFFSGIGGMRYGVKQALQQMAKTASAADQSSSSSSSRNSFKLESCEAYEISLHANRTYAHNFQEKYSTTTQKTSKKSSSSTRIPKFSVTTKLVEQLNPEDLDGAADLWTLSPPCQPFTTTKGAKQLDATDKRNAGIKGLMNILKVIDQKPKWILLENVKGFVGSQVLSMWYETLAQCGYSWKEYLLSPTQVGVPNHRTRYYIICEHNSKRWNNCTLEKGAISTILPGILEGSGMVNCNVATCQPLSTYVQCLNDNDVQPYLLSDDTLRKDWAKELSFVTPEDSITYCFTAAYGRILHKASGSLLLMPVNNSSLATAASTRSPSASGAIESSTSTSGSQENNMLRYAGRVRRFTPRELLSLFGFPSEFTFPKDIPLEHQYKLIGNSVNVTVVSRVATELLLPLTL